MPKHLSARALVRTRRPEFPVYCLRHHAVDTASRWFQQHFPGRVLFAVKTNPLFVQALTKSGLRHFDVASIAEIEEVAANVPNARMSFMHPVKNRDAIRRAYFDFGVRDFALDSEEELKKILDETNCAEDLNLFVRIAVNNRHSRMSLSGKFGISGREARRLLFKVRQVGRGLGVCFHAGSQIMHPRAYVEAMKRVAKCIRRSGVIIDYPEISSYIPDALEQLAGTINLVLEQKKFPLVLGGEHSLTAGSIRPFVERFPDLAILHFDAHADLRDGYEGEHFSHAAALRRVMDHTIDTLVSVGIRNISAGEIGFLESNSNRIHVHWAKDRKHWDPLAIVEPLRDRPVYLTFDLDGFDSSFMSATGTPEPGGLYWDEAIAIIRAA